MSTDFGWALARLREGMKVTREGWEPYGMYVVKLGPILLLRTPSDARVPWVAVSGDLLGEDWLCATADGEISWPDGTVA
ncbi:MAG: MW1434 family type I TA system toxin [Gemmatimonadaceae bacterium]